jgi:ankyrin repeat protein
MNDRAKIEYLIDAIAQRKPLHMIEEMCKDFSLNDIDSSGRTPLMVAAADDHLAAVEVLVKNGASLHIGGRSRMTALHEASASGRTAIAEYLLGRGAVVDAQTDDGVTPLMCAAAWGNFDVAKILLENGADRTKTDRTGATAAEIAREKGEDETADLIDSWI